MPKVYFAVGSRDYLHLLLLSGARNILCSYAYPEPYSAQKFLKKHDIKMFVDSGAFTLWTKGKTVNIDDYIQFIKDNWDVIDTERIVNLDIILGGHKKATPEEFDAACKKGFENYYYMKEKLGVDPIHVFHQGENFVWLEKMLRECTYIGISPNNDEPVESKDKWLYDCFSIIKNSNNPNIKTHAFGLTTESLLEKYPYTTADSSAWALSAAFGSILTPLGRFTLSEVAKNDPDYIEYKPEEIKNKVYEYIQQFGFSPKMAMDIKKGYRFRCMINIHYYLQMEERLNANPVTFNDSQGFLFNPLDWDRKKFKNMCEKNPEYEKTYKDLIEGNHPTEPVHW